MIDAKRDGVLHFWLGVKGHTHARCLQHGNVIGTIAHGNGIGRRQAVDAC